MEDTEDREVERNDVYQGLIEIFEGIKINTVMEGIALFLADTFYETRDNIKEHYDDPIQAQIDNLSLRVKYYIETMDKIKEELDKK